MSINRFVEKEEVHKGDENKKSGNPSFFLCSVNKFHRTENIRSNVQKFLDQSQIIDSFNRPTDQVNLNTIAVEDEDSDKNRVHVGEYFTTERSIDP
jgi:hypothetical protein